MEDGDSTRSSFETCFSAARRTAKMWWKAGGSSLQAIGKEPDYEEQRLVIVTRSIAMLAALMAATACCDDSNKYMELIPWGDGMAVPPITVSVADSFPFSAYVTGTPNGSGFFADCRLYDSQTAPDRFEVTVSDTSVAEVRFGASENHVVAKKPGPAVLIVASSGVADIELPFTVVAGLASSNSVRGGTITLRSATALNDVVAASARCARSGVHGALRAGA